MKDNKTSSKNTNTTPDLLDILLDRENRNNIFLKDDNGKIIEFEQICVIPYDLKGQDRILYAVLKPINVEGIADDEAVVFKVVFPNGTTALVLEEDENRAKNVFEKYYDILNEATKERQNKKK